MFAYVRFIDDDVCSIVSTEKIKKFDVNDSRKFELKYYVQYEDGEYYKANVIYLKESIEELKAIIKAKRTKLINKNLLVSQSSDDDDSIVEYVSKVDEPKKKKENNSKKRTMEDVSKQKLEDDIFSSYNNSISQDAGNLSTVQKKNMAKVMISS
ncbi:PREDICTED: uncharacterized protein LOC105461460, partial [Wasmannia auropunctata]|uniref:uncharacterized protein LOC105461460 n=1 Tax=Wasmannia auropunctata TaxID=64793 RepID=UPI0005EEF9E8